MVNEKTELTASEDSEASELSDLLCCCEFCNDGEGNCAFPIYGVAPHTHVPQKIKDKNDLTQWIGSTRINPEHTWPENFKEDPDSKGCGTYTHCLSCGRPRNKAI